MDNFIFAVNSVMPIVLLIALGYLLKKIGLIDKNFLATGNKLCFKVLLPIMLFYNVFGIGSLDGIDWSIAAYCVGSIVGAFAIGLIVVAIFVPERDRKGVVLQGVFRTNYAMIGLPLAEMLFGAEGKALASLMAAFAIPVLNTFAVIALTIYGEKTDKPVERIKNTLLNIVKNPLIHGVVLGVVFVLIRQAFIKYGISFRLSDIKFLNTAVRFISTMTTPFALIILGGQFELDHFKKYAKELTVATVTRTMIVPAICLLIACVVFGFRGVAVAVFVAIYGSPVATASAIMAREMGGDADLAGAIVVSTTIVSSVTLVAIITVLKACAVI